MRDVIVVGGGAAGLSVAQVLGRARRDVVLVSGGDQRNAPAAGVHGVIGHDGVSPAELARCARKELDRYPTVSVVDGEVSSVSGARDDFAVALSDGESVLARRVVLATGVIDDLPPVPGLAERWGGTVLHCPYCHGWEVRDEPLAVLALSIVDAYVAAHLTQWSSDVVFCANGITIGEDQLVVLCAAGIRPRAGTLTAVEDTPGGVRLVFADGTSLDRRAVFVHAPTRQRAEVARGLGCEHLEDDSVVVDELGQTSVPGVYAVGDMARRRDQEPGLTFVARAMGDGLIAAVAVNRDLYFSSLSFD
ncbi:NAD(P)/FAD-dependent oxidoreductase [Actinokineospora sp.]|uniref:NAD(P)/FAD-dependent oxidoreductase n=1 Tax=Actinokineospora sp. TaxID=1872133 RepID=UPI0040383C03